MKYKATTDWGDAFKKGEIWELIEKFKNGSTMITLMQKDENKARVIEIHYMIFECFFKEME